MEFPQEIIDEIKELYPEFTKLAEAGNPTILRGLADSVPQNVPFDLVLNATSLEDLKAQATILKRKYDLTSKCWKLYNQYNNIYG